MIALASASLGLVAALAWNEAIKETIKQVFGAGDSLAGLYAYAIIATVIAVIVLLMLARRLARRRRGRDQPRGRRVTRLRIADKELVVLQSAIRIPQSSQSWRRALTGSMRAARAAG